jgi:TonB-dependent starch-binding outer membrane protein SusC
VDLGLFNNRLTFVTDYYLRKSKNMLLNEIIPAITGFSSQIVNKGSIRNTGIEFNLGGTPISGKFKWETNINVSFNRNKVLSLSGDERILAGSIDGRPTHITVVGEPIGQFFGFIFDGLYTADDLKDPNVPTYPAMMEGQSKYKDLDGDGKLVEELDYTIIGNPHPDLIYGLNNNFSYKNFDLAIIISGQYGGSVINALRQTVDGLFGFFNVSHEWVNRWRSADNPGDGTHAGIVLRYPTLIHRVSDRWVEDATYLRISNVTLGYSLPYQIVNKTGFINNCRFYITAQNLATFTNYSGGNPEGQSAQFNNVLCPGFDVSSYPLARNISFGVNLSF